MRTVNIRARVRDSLVVLSVLLASGLAACSGGDSGGGNTGMLDLLADVGYVQDTSPVDLPPPGDSPSKPDGQVQDVPGPTTVGLLEFVDRNGDDGVSCVGSNRCSKKFESVEIRELKVRYREDGLPTPNKAIHFEITRGPAGLAELLSNGTVITDENGQATIEFRVKEPPEQSALAQLEVTVSVVSRPDVDEVFFDILIDIKGEDQAPLTVLPDYTGDQPVESVRLRLFRQPPDPRNEGQYVSTGVSCRDLVPFIRNDNENRMPAYDIPSTEFEIGSSYQFQEVHFVDPTLEAEPEQMYTVLAIGRDATNVNRIVGCDDQNAKVRRGESITVVVPMNDLPPRLKGEYEVLSKFDLVSALPDDVEEVVNIILNFFDSPSLTILQLLCMVGEDFTEDLCGYVLNDNGTPTTTGTIIIGILDGIIEGLGQGNWFGTTMQVGADIRLLLKELTFLSVLEFDAEPEDDGWIDPRTTHEDWHAFRYRWGLGIPACETNPDLCWNEYSLRTIGMELIDGQFEASVNADAVGNVRPFMLLTIEEHPLNIQYGALLNFIIKKIVLPRLAGGEPPDGLPVVDEYDELIKSILAGRECLEDELTGGFTCCETFAQNILQDTDIPMAESLITAACEALVDFGSQYIENLLVGLDLSTGETFVIGTMPGAPCRMYDGNDDLVIDAFGRAGDATACHWQARVSLNIGGGTELLFDAKFWGCRAGTSCSF